MPAIRHATDTQQKVLPLEAEVVDKPNGRPRVPRKPAMPLLELTDNERAWVDYQMYIYNIEYALSESDQIMLHLVAIEYIKYLRTIAWELATDQQITMAKQHPGTRYDALIDRLGLTRRHRMSKQIPEDADKLAMQAALRELSR